jgi:hypothetical protein
MSVSVMFHLSISPTNIRKHPSRIALQSLNDPQQFPARQFASGRVHRSIAAQIGGEHISQVHARNGSWKSQQRDQISTLAQNWNMIDFASAGRHESFFRVWDSLSCDISLFAL